MRGLVWTMAVAFCILGPAGCAGGPEAQDDSDREARPAAGQQPPARKIAPHLYRIGAVVINSKERTVRCPGRVNMEAGGPVELLACLPRGKVHESVFTLDLEPVDLQVALLLLDMQAGRNPSVEYPEDSPELSKPPGDEALIFVEWREPSRDDGEHDGAELLHDGAELLRVRAEEFLYNVQTERAMTETTWVFLGSRLLDGAFGADLDGSLITTFHDPLAILELVLPTVNDDVYYFVNEERCPPVGTPVELIIRAPQKREETEGEREHQ